MACSHMSLQGMLGCENVSMQDTLACEHVKHMRHVGM